MLTATRTTPSAFVANRERFSAAGIVGLGCFAAGLLLTSLPLADLSPGCAPFCAAALLYAATGQLLAGISAWRRQQAYPAVVLTAFGLFWFSRLAFEILPRSGHGTPPLPAASCCLLLLWGLFALILSGADECPRPLRHALALVAGSLLLQASAALILPLVLKPLATAVGVAAATALAIAALRLFRAERLPDVARG